MKRLQLQRTALAASSAGDWLIPRAGLRLRRHEGRWQLQATEWIYRNATAAYEVPAVQRWLKATGLAEAHFPTRRAALEELERLWHSHPLRPRPVIHW